LPVSVFHLHRAFFVSEHDRFSPMSRREVLALAGATTATALWPRRLSALARALGSSPLRVNGARLNERLAKLSEFGRNPQGGVTRLAYSDADVQARAWALSLMRDAGLATEIDAAGNLIGRRAGRDAGRKPILFGSHIDSVPEGGNYDGDVGSLSAIEVAKTLQENGAATRHPLEVVIFQNEEGGLIGSRAMSGELETKELSLVSRSGKTIGEGLTFLGGDLTKLDSVRRKKGDIAAYVELHIEQGGILDATKTDIGVVEGIVGINWWDVTIEGFANHAGTTPMDHRQDAMLAAARFTIAVNRIVTSEPGRQVGTVGRITALPGAPNVVPGKVVLSLELRDLDSAKIQTLFRRIVDESKKIGAENGTTFSFTETNVNIPAPTDPRVRAVIARSARELGLSTRVMPSGAGHDAQDMTRLGPVGMIFVPSVNGISHAPKEFSRPADIENGANVLLQTVLTLDAEME
jgi:beta-ureidopropionase / N-carbamoyl-L-amino-acid hydrolase